MLFRIFYLIFLTKQNFYLMNNFEFLRIFLPFSRVFFLSSWKSIIYNFFMSLYYFVLYFQAPWAPPKHTCTNSKWPCSTNSSTWRRDRAGVRATFSGVTAHLFSNSNNNPPSSSGKACRPGWPWPPPWWPVSAPSLVPGVKRFLASSRPVVN